MPSEIGIPHLGQTGSTVVNVLAYAADPDVNPSTASVPQNTARGPFHEENQYKPPSGMV